MDPLALVRQATTQKTPVNYTSNHYFFAGNVKLHESTETAFKRTLKGAGYYTLRDIIFFLENAEVGLAQYRANVNAAAGVTAVVLADSKDLKAYLTGEIATCPQIDEAKRAQYVATAAAAAAASSSSSQLTQQQRHPSSGSDSSTLQPHPSASASVSSAAASTPEHLQAARQKVLQSFLHLQPEAQGEGHPDSSSSFLARGAPKPQHLLVKEPPASLSADEMSYMTADREVLSTLRADEFAASNRSSVLCKPGADFSFVLKLVNDHVLRTESNTSAAAREKAKQMGKKRASDSGDPNTAPSKRSSSSGSARKASSSLPPPGAMSGAPIFIVPDALTATFSGFNATQFLRDGNFVSSEECRQRGLKRSPEGHRFTHTCKNGKKIEFKVVDNGKKLSTEEWARVVVVFVQGQAWQFKGWHYSNPVEVFDKALGIHVCLDDGSEVAKNILSWKCEVLKIHKTRRHMDASAFNEFWLLVEDYMRMHRPWLLADNKK